jgi:hypothetical protein
MPSMEIHGGGLDRPARIQMVVALVLGLALVAIPLYLWRRPRSDGAIASEEGKAAALAGADAAVPAAMATPAPPAVALSEPVVLECHDSGSRRTPADQCDRLVTIEKALAHAIEQEAACVPTSSGGGALPYVLDISFARKRNPIQLTVARDGRTLKGSKAAASCTSAVKHAMGDLALDGIAHAHARYKVQIVATYPSATR